MKATLKFMVPMFVVIDTDAEETITRVVVDDGDVQDEICFGVFAPDGKPIEEHRAWLEAVQAYREYDKAGLAWPAWEFGW